MKTKIMLTALLLSISAQAIAQTYVFRAVSGAPVGESSLVGRDSGGEAETPTEPPEEPPQDEYGGSWWAFAQEHSLPHGAWDQGIAWSNRSLSNVPSAPYPATFIFNSIDLSGNNIPYINSFNQLDYFMGSLRLNNNSLSSIDLSSLTHLQGDLDLSDNQLTSISFQLLDSVMNKLDISNNELYEINFGINDVSVGELDLRNNQITDIRNISNVIVINRVYIDENYSGPRIPFYSNFCQSMNYDKLIGPEITQICEFPM